MKQQLDYGSPGRINTQEEPSKVNNFVVKYHKSYFG